LLIGVVRHASFEPTRPSIIGRDQRAMAASMNAASSVFKKR
jgi:hypothetical protein